jgi:hypothetical protein
MPIRKLVNLIPLARQPLPHPFTHRPQTPDIPIRQQRPLDHALVENAGWDSINFGRRSIQNSTLQNSLAVKSSDHSWRGKANAEKLKS